MKSQSTTAQSMSSDQERLARILDDYLVAIEQGQTVSPQELLARHPEDAEKLRGYLSGLQLFHAAAAGQLPAASGPAAEGVPPALQTIGDYRLVREIGRGGMGVVYEAWQVSLRRRVALKVLPFTSANDAKQIGRFKNEAQAAAQIQHPNIVPVYAVGEENGVHYYVMPLIEGQSLTSLLGAMRSGGKETDGTTAPNNSFTKIDERGADIPVCRQTGMSVPRCSQPMRASETADHIRVVARLGVQAAEALDAAHDFGIVHRDVKPSNLLLDDQGKLWITDFGLARWREDKGLTQTGDVLGTMRYMSPEQAQGRTALVDERTDVYSLGLTMYELATLNHPADEISDGQLAFARNRPTVKPLRHWNRHIPADFQTIVLKCLAEFPHERYSSARELANDLERFLEGRPILASPPSFVSRVGKWAKRRRGVVYGAAAVLLIAACGLYVNMLQTARAKSERIRVVSESLRDTHVVLDRQIETANRLQAIPGAEGVFKDFLNNTLHLYQKYAAQAVDDPSLAIDMAVSNSKLGTLNAKIGNRDAAIKSHALARDVWRQRLAREPSNAEYARNLAGCLNSLGLLLMENGQESEAIALFSEASDRQKKLRSADPNSTSLATELATTHSNLGLVLMRTDAKSDAANEFREAISILRPIAESGGDERALRRLAASYNNYAFLQETTDTKSAAETYQRAIDLQKKLVKSNQVDRDYRAELARSYSNLGVLASRGKDWKKAEICYLDAIQLQEDLIKASPLVASYRRDLVISYNNLGRALSRGGRFVEAEVSFEKAVKLQDGLLAAQSNDVQTLSNQGSVLNNLAQLLDRQQRYADAAAAYKQAVHFQSEALHRAKGNDAIRALLSKHYFNYAASLAEQEKFTDAVNVTLQRKKLWAGQPERSFAVAQELAGLYRRMSRNPGTDVAKSACVEAAAATLREAVAAGLSRERLKDTSLSSLYASPDFRHLMDDSRVGATSAASAPTSTKRVN